MEKYGRTRQITGDHIVRRIRIECWIIKAKDTHSEYVMLLRFPRQQYLCERACVIRGTYVAFIVV